MCCLVIAATRSGGKKPRTDIQYFSRLVTIVLSSWRWATEPRNTDCFHCWQECMMTSSLPADVCPLLTSSWRLSQVHKLTQAGLMIWCACSKLRIEWLMNSSAVMMMSSCALVGRNCLQLMCNCVQCNCKVRIRFCVEMGQFWIIWNLGASVKLFLTMVWPCHDYIHIILDTVSNWELARYHFCCTFTGLPVLYVVYGKGWSVKVDNSAMQDQRASQYCS